MVGLVPVMQSLKVTGNGVMVQKLAQIFGLVISMVQVLDIITGQAESQIMQATKTVLNFMQTEVDGMTSLVELQL
jgi:hypothetical protein